MRRYRVSAASAASAVGLSLIELMVALAIGSVLSFAAVNLFLQSKISYLQDEEMARLQENGRYALRYISHQLTMAGYMATVLPGEPIGSTLSGSSCFNHLLDTSLPLGHVNNVTANGTPAGGVRSLPQDCLLAGRHQRGSDIVLSRRTVDSPVVRQGEARGAIDPLAIYLRTDNRGVNPTLLRGGGSPGGQVDLWEYVPQVLFLRNYSVRPGDGIPTLCRKRPGRTSNRMAPTVCLIEGIENLQLEFGIDEDGDQRADRFEQQPAPAELRAAVAARIFLLVRSVHPLPATVDDRSYTLGSTVVPPAKDAHYRRVMQTTVLLRNSGAFSQSKAFSL